MEVMHHKMKERTISFQPMVFFLFQNTLRKEIIHFGLWHCKTGFYLAGKSCSEGFTSFSMAKSTGLVSGLSERTDTSLAGVSVWLT